MSEFDFPVAGDEKPPIGEHPTEIAEGLQTPEKTGDYLRSQAFFLHNLGDLMDTLQRTTEPDVSQRTFEYFVSESSLHLPLSVSMNCGNNASQVTVTVTKEAAKPAITSLELTFADRTLYISRDPERQTVINPGEQESDYVLLSGVRNPIAIERIPTKDVNAIIVELTTGVEAHGIEDLAYTDILSPDLSDNFMEVLQRTAHRRFASYNHRQATRADRTLAWNTAGSGEGDAMTDCRLSYETGTPNRHTVVDIDARSGVRLDFSIRDLDKNTFTPFSPDTGDILRLQEIMAELTAIYDDVEVKSHDFTADNFGALTKVDPEHHTELDSND